MVAAVVTPVLVGSLAPVPDGLPGASGGGVSLFAPARLGYARLAGTVALAGTGARVSRQDRRVQAGISLGAVGALVEPLQGLHTGRSATATWR